MPRVLLLADIASEHTQKWALGLASRGIEVGIFSFNREKHQWYKENKRITILFQPEKAVNAESLLTKVLYIRYAFRLNRIINKFKPDILHAHYATSYGLVGRLCGFHPFVISAWGTDVMRFPQQNGINKSLLKQNLNEADAICATSHTIENYIHQIIRRDVEVIPFGVDTEVFKPDETKRHKEKIVIGCVKSLRNIYRVDVLIKAFALLTKEITEHQLELLIVGSGEDEAKLKELVQHENLTQRVVFAGKVPHELVPGYFQQMDIVANLSEYESFGVSVIEAMACECAVVVTDTGGLQEIVNSDDLGIRVSVDDIHATMQALKKYVQDEALRKLHGERGREHVQKHYAWHNNLQEMIKVYTRLIK